MTKEEVNALLDQLKSGELTEVTVEKKDFDLFSSVLRARDDFKHFRGIARHYGKTVYHYLEEPRS
ncbi:hypothetical protein KP77_16440 [Jeotgalibacillus alimentarius]|uniref:Abortive phage infection protein n=1 Tax=Jeotgalibacillus alimentarius TaxID=135826 RepID=A0A0C2S8B8_9BACL|nr:hypothetical protein [Jeotgalibacillus alimentarius]KIL50269.1 hypothetical protein KP77_16440 [Jeotgalibacillus alimentarius]